MILTPFDAADELIIVPATIWNPRGAYRQLLMAGDTGSTETLVIPHITDELGYGAISASRSSSSGRWWAENKDT